MRTLLGVGARGDIVRQVQTALSEQGFSAGNIDGDYGNGTSSAVKRFQSSTGANSTGVIDEDTWTALLKTPVPPVSERSLQLTASFEGHGFTLAEGNFDGAFVTWGIIGFTLKHGEVQAIVLNINSSHPELITQAFGDNATELLNLMTADPEFQRDWANAHTVAGGHLAQPWKDSFAKFGSFPEVQAEQRRRAHDRYLVPAIATAKRLGFTSELGLALCFDIHVQNGGIKSEVMPTVLSQIKGKSEADARVVVANAAADSADPRFSQDVRTRKLTVATGSGTVHGAHYTLSNWGLSGDFAASELAETTGAAA